jgi:hypothetical protein
MFPHSEESIRPFTLCAKDQEKPHSEVSNQSVKLLLMRLSLLQRELAAKLRATTAMLSRRRTRLKELLKETDEMILFLKNYFKQTENSRGQ